jgi:hypothetical protein
LGYLVGLIGSFVLILKGGKKWRTKLD